jgi:hypothetical protein
MSTRTRKKAKPTTANVNGKKSRKKAKSSVKIVFSKRDQSDSKTTPRKGSPAAVLAAILSCKSTHEDVEELRQAIERGHRPINWRNPLRER